MMETPLLAITAPESEISDNNEIQNSEPKSESNPGLINFNENPDHPLELHYLRSCYICKARFSNIHFFYDNLCPDCAKLAYEKRTQSSDLRGRIAIVTGGRI